jgi:hypothetical protein
VAKTPEKAVKDKVVKLLKEYGVYYFFPATHGFGVSGLFDICAMYKGHFIGIETKADCKKKPTELQSLNAKKAMDAGTAVLLIHNENVAEVTSLLEEIDNDKEIKPNRRSIWTFKSQEAT